MVPQNGLRRRRSNKEDEEDADIVRSSQSPAPSTSSKRARLNEYGSDGTPPSESPEPEPAPLQRSTKPIVESGSQFQVGSIVRVKLIDFVTYARAEFFPGPHLNMVIGPNGTGKSSLVCAICLGLGWGPQHLGRAGQIGEFVKHNQSHSFIEIELQGPKGQSNHVVKVKIIRDTNGREWWLNGKKCTLKEVQNLCKSLSIQVDNLCQFLPQDKVSQFAALTPVDLLQQTQRAAAPAEMLVWHEELKKARKQQKELQGQEAENQEELARIEARIANLQGQKEQIEERNNVEAHIKRLQGTLPCIEYRDIKKKLKEVRERKKIAQGRLKRLEDESRPSLAAVESKQSYRNAISSVVDARKKALQRTESEAQAALDKIEKLDVEINDYDQRVEAEKQQDKKRAQDVAKSRSKLRDLEAQYRDNVVPEFVATEWNERIRAKEKEKRDIQTEVVELKDQNQQFMSSGKAIRDEIRAHEQAINESKTQEGQQMTRIATFSRDAGEAWKWIQDHREDFEKELYAPAVVSCGIKKEFSAYTALVEASLGFKDFLAFTCQTRNDSRKLSDKLNGNPQNGGLGLADVTIRTIDVALGQLSSPPMGREDMERCGLDGWALDYIDGPEPVLAMLCNSARINATGIALREVTNDQHDMLVQGACNNFVTGNTSSKVNHRKDLGSQATTTVTKTIGRPRMWTEDQIVDTSANSEAEAQIERLKATFEEIKGKVQPVRTQIAKLDLQLKNLTVDIAALNKEKGDLQKAYGEYRTLPTKIERERENYQRLAEGAAELKQKVRSLYVQQDNAVMQRLKLILAHKGFIETMRKRHIEYLDAKMRLIEADSDVDSLSALNRAVLERIRRETELLREVEAETAATKQRGVDIHPVLIKVMAEAHGNGDYFKAVSNEIEDADVTYAEREAEVAAEEARLEYMHASNPNAIRQFEETKAAADKLKQKMDSSANTLEKLDRDIKSIRNKWEPALDELIAEISEAFSYNFEQIGCAGEIGVHKDEDFDQWAIQIKVKFRQSESLQILDQHRQSGGERSVSTIFYLMSLQSLAQSPFRVVDEINQGMDPRNERMVHERMVEIACNKHTSQYFLITPKLLTGLRYDRLMNTHVINSGEHVFEEANKRFSADHIIRLKRASVLNKAAA